MIDWDHVEELRAEIGDDGFCEVVDLFLEEVELVVDRLEAAPDPATFEQDLHFLKGSAWNLGFAEFGSLCMAGEKLAGDGRAAGIDIREITRSYRASRVTFMAGARGFCSKLSAA
ncbi:MAG: Hpt domain-containing protein [Allopontixanthobacter sediminis]